MPSISGRKRDPCFRASLRNFSKEVPFHLISNSSESQKVKERGRGGRGCPWLWGVDPMSIGPGTAAFRFGPGVLIGFNSRKSEFDLVLDGSG